MTAPIKKLNTGMPVSFERPDPEVPAKTQRRRFTAAYKRRILREADACGEPGESGALLRREGLYSSRLTQWRQHREAGTLEALSRPRGRQVSAGKTPAERIVTLEREHARLRQRRHQAEAWLEIPKKVSELLGIPLTPAPSAGSD
jgi:transposase